MRSAGRLAVLAGGLTLLNFPVAAEKPVSGRHYPRLVIRNAMVADGNGTPASGPKDIVIENGRITSVVASTMHPESAAEIDAAGKYVLPGLINMHGHLQTERAGLPQPIEYELKL